MEFKLKHMFMLGLVAVSLGALTSCGGYLKVRRNDLGLSLREVRKSRGYKSDLQSTGDAKVLVIPVDFVDYPCSASSLAKYGGCDGIRDDIRRTMFGTAEETNWESLSSFYSESSYGKLNISGKVTDWFRPKLSAAQLAMPLIDDPDNHTGISDSVLDEAIEWYRANNDDIADYDTDGDGYLDAVYVIYTVPAQTKIGKIDSSSLFWAYTYWSNAHSDIEDVKKNHPEELPVPYTYFWASISFMYEDKMLDANGNYVDCKDENGDWLPDAHTFIHESGHILGLPDYYTYGTQEGYEDYGALGGIDMMDNNVGDHNAYSKMLYGWTEPIQIKNSTTITLKPFYKSGDFVLLNANWNGSMYDEYLLLEYYMPEGLNKYDSEHQFAGSYPQAFQKPGLKVMHVDSRLGGFDYPGQSNLSFDKSGKFANYVTEIDKRYDYCDVAADNTVNRSVVPEFKLIELLESSGECTFDDRDEYGRLTNPYATDESLFHEGDTFGYEGGPFANFRFNTGRMIRFDENNEPYVDENDLGNEVGFKFKVLSMNENGVTIQFESTQSK